MSKLRLYLLPVRLFLISKAPEQLIKSRRRRRRRPVCGSFGVVSRHAQQHRTHAAGLLIVFVTCTVRLSDGIDERVEEQHV